MSTDVTADGSPVEVYRRLPPAGEADVIHSAIPAGASILELDGRTWRQAFTAEMLDDDGLRAVLLEAGLELVDYLDEERTWARAAPCDNRAP